MLVTSSRWQDIYLHLQNAGFDVRSPATSLAECTSKYIVVKNDGMTAHSSFSTDVEQYAIMCYVPQKQYSELEPYVQAVKEAMKTMEPMILPFGFQTPSFFDDAIKAHMTSVQYKNYKKRL